VSGEYADYTAVFFTWVQYAHYWPWPLLGALIPALLFYVIQLLRA